EGDTGPSCDDFPYSDAKIAIVLPRHGLQQGCLRPTVAGHSSATFGVAVPMPGSRKGRPCSAGTWAPGRPTLDRWDTARLFTPERAPTTTKLRDDVLCNECEGMRIPSPALPHTPEALVREYAPHRSRLGLVRPGS